jgi:hypothetical protein
MSSITLVHPEATLSEFRSSLGSQETEGAYARGRIAALDEKARHCDRAIAVLQDKLARLSTDFGCLAGAISALRSVPAAMQSLSGEVSALKSQIVEQLSTEVSELRKEVSTLWRCHPLPGSIRGLFRTFRRSSQSSERSVLAFCGGAATMVSKQKNVTADTTAAQTL